ncbi:hypothetical protein BUBS_29 [Bacillus phage Bubs]|uniref:hypothetical protein n=1 Tax=Bacillus phage Nemo TaxID=1805950 RepID=UPI0007A76AA0|nr:hypothetical protein BI006_gp029 [Bacillus phage Nemo]AMW63655.1 hypothetical protein NEMO_29 [Bacillus phage Nemo]ASR78641.1 hypothetical protein BUBS_29 [Bacillus phage Bubs]
MFKLRQKIKFPCFYNDRAFDQKDFLIVKETKSGIKFTIQDKLNGVEVAISVPLLNAMEIRTAISSAMIGTIDERFDINHNVGIWVRDTRAYNTPLVSLLLVGRNDSESICITTKQALQLNDFIEEVYKNGSSIQV